MELFPPDIRAAMLEAGRLRLQAIETMPPENAAEFGLTLPPLVKIIMREPRRVWLLTDIDPIAGNFAFGLADLNTGLPKMDWVGLYALAAARDTLGLSIERDVNFTPQGTLNDYAIEAILCGQIVDLGGSDSGPPTYRDCLDDDERLARSTHVVYSEERMTLAAIKRKGEETAEQFLARIYAEQKRQQETE